ncbi:MAG: RNA polymerase sigma factor [Porphyromonadaceae bacterium]|nr:RNA polymerase sigma factor [Porphyromonadaceae bacterium]
MQTLIRIYNTFVDDLFHYAVNFGFDRELIMDAIHDVFYKISQDNSLLDNVDNIKFYLYRSLKNRLIDIVKTRKEDTMSDVSAFTENLPFNVEVNIEDLLISEEEQTAVRSKIEEMLSVLSDRQREIIYLRYVDGYDYSDISRLLGITVPSCHKLTYKSMQKLRKKFGPLILLFLIP